MRAKSLTLLPNAGPARGNAKRGSGERGSGRLRRATSGSRPRSTQHRDGGVRLSLSGVRFSLLLFMSGQSGFWLDDPDLGRARLQAGAAVASKQTHQKQFRVSYFKFEVFFETAALLSMKARVSNPILVGCSGAGYAPDISHGKSAALF